ncbi:MAG: DUF1634 domain-containing protein [Gammaproteobacteria bacterium]|nr:DUF1634 domain-containing protein [Gammaproteobacteria bacterium]
MASKTLQTWISGVLIFGIILAVGLVSFGYTIYLVRHAHEAYAFSISYNFASLKQFFDGSQAFYFSSRNLIELGFLTLVASQIVRIGMLLFHYLYKKDWRFSLICSFVLLILVSGLFFQN